jgi:hypothetical protein
MALDWKRLKPHLPLGPADAAYVDRPADWNGGQRLAALLAKGLGPLAVAGPVGSGKSTELAATETVLAKTQFVVRISLDLAVDLNDTSLAAVLDAVGAAIFHLAMRTATLNPDQYAGIWGADRVVMYLSPGLLTDNIQSMIREIQSNRRDIALIILLDGLEKAETESARAIVGSLCSALQDASIAIVVPPSLVNGPQSHDVLTSFRVCSISPVPELNRTQHTGAAEFLRAIALRRLGLPEWPASLLPFVDQAARCSGGVPRTFLQLLVEAAAWADLDGREELRREDMQRAYLSHHDTLTRLLQSGDSAALVGSRGTDGKEVPADRKVRLLTHGLLLEYEVGGKRTVYPHPMLDDLDRTSLADGRTL